MQKQHFRTVWLSDIHLGHKDCKAEFLLDFLNHVRIDTLYLVGDIVDMWEMSKRLLWPESHNQLLHRLLTLTAQGTQVIYLPGNHDAPVQKYDGLSFADIDIRRELIHTTADGKRLLVLHGDQFDEEVCFGRLHAWIGDKAYDLLLFVNRWYNKARIALGGRYWSLAGHIKSKVRSANIAMQRYRQACVDAAVSRGLDGVVCGHIHHAEVTDVDGTLYCNDGDWLESCCALTENHRGELQILSWTSVKRPNILYAVENTPTRKVA